MIFQVLECYRDNFPYFIVVAPINSQRAGRQSITLWLKISDNYHKVTKKVVERFKVISSPLD